MPAIVRGGGGGKSTKDATAVPVDVRSGKTFYGADGKQTGIWTPKVTDYTGDATATTEDVMAGKVFYNNDGRQVGSKSETIKGLKVINLSIPKKIYREASTDMIIDSYIRADDIGNLFVDINQYEKTFRCIKIQSFNFNAILGFELDGTMTLNDNAKIRKGKALIHESQGSQVNENSGLLNLAIVFYNKNIYLGHETYEYMEEFTSIEPNFAQNLKVYYI